MEMFDSSYSPSCVLNEQIARQVFDILPEDGPMMVIISKQGNYWPSDAEVFTKLGITDGYIKELCAKIDDGEEPIITNVNDFSLVITGLATERNDPSEHGTACSVAAGAGVHTEKAAAIKDAAQSA